MEEEIRPPRLSILKQKAISEEELNLSIKASSSKRRVSFAASNYVKPFVADAEHNTIWDNTYEEIVNHTDSTASSHNTKSCDELNTSTIFGNQKQLLKIWSDSDNESSETEVIVKSTIKGIKIYEDTTLKLNKENLNPSKINETQMETCDMEVTMIHDISNEQIDENLETVTMDFTKIIDRTIITGENVNKTILKTVDMEESIENVGVFEKQGIREESIENERVSEEKQEITEKNLENEKETRILEPNAKQDVSAMDISYNSSCKVDNETIKNENNIEESEKLQQIQFEINNSLKYANKTIMDRVDMEETEILESNIIKETSTMDISINVTCQSKENYLTCDNKTINDQISVEETKIVDSRTILMSEIDLKTVENDTEIKIPDEIVDFHDTTSKPVEMEISGISNLEESSINSNLKEASLERNFKNIILNNKNIEIDVSCVFENNSIEIDSNKTEFIDDSQTNFASRTFSNLTETFNLTKPIKSSTPYTNLSETEKNPSFAINLTVEDISINNLENTVESFKMISGTPGTPFVDDVQSGYIGYLNEKLDLYKIPSIDEFNNEDYDYKPPNMPEEFNVFTNTLNDFKDFTDKINTLNKLKENCSNIRRAIDEKLRENLKKQINLLDEQNLLLEDFFDDLTTTLENSENNLECSSDIEMIEVISQKVQIASQKSEACYKYEKHDSNNYYFSSLNGSFSFKVELIPQSEIIQNIHINISDRNYSDRPINYFLLKALEEKLNPNNLKQLFGEKYDILTLLDYWNIAVEENIDFFEEFRYLQCFNKHDLNIIIDKNYKISFNLLCIKPCMNWTITVKLCPKNYAIENDGEIEIYDELNKVSQKEKFINNMLHDIPKDKHFLNGFIRNIRKFFENSKTLCSQKDLIMDLRIGCAEYFKTNL